MIPSSGPHIRSGTRFVGRSVPRREDRGPLTGGSRYIADVKLAGMLEVVFVRSTEAHARIVSVDTSEARAVDGVEAVFTATDLAEVESFPDHIDSIGPVRQRPLATDRVRYVGAPYAAVVATDRYVAEDAGCARRGRHRVRAPADRRRYSAGARARSAQVV